MGTSGVLGGSVQSFNPLNSLSMTINLDPNRKIPCCPKCWRNCAMRLTIVFLSGCKMRNQKINLRLRIKNIQELQKTWRDECFRIHPKYNQSSRLDRVAPMVVSFAGAGYVAHEDFEAHKGTIGAGNLQWMTAGRGIVYSEMPASNGTKKGLHIWINLSYGLCLYSNLMAMKNCR